MGLAASLTSSAERDGQLAVWFESQPRILDEDLTSAAKLRVVVFSDYQCPICAIVVPEFRRIVERYQKAGYPQVELVIRDFPLDPSCNKAVAVNMHPVACQAAAAVRLIERAAGERAAALARRTLYSKRGELTDAVIAACLEQSGLLHRFQTEKSSEMAGVIRDAEAGARLGVHGTPTVFVDGRATRSVTPDMLAALIAYRLRNMRPTATQSSAAVK
jgi:protein-disulfide isomerase